MEELIGKYFAIKFDEGTAVSKTIYFMPQWIEADDNYSRIFCEGFEIGKSYNIAFFKNHVINNFSDFKNLKDYEITQQKYFSIMKNEINKL
jgi:hypothetical protein